MRQVILLRGINVGKSIQISMKELKGWLEGIGFRDVETYLNSGNVLFESESDASESARMAGGLIREKTGKTVPLLVKTSDEIVRIARSVPAGWLNDETQQTYVAYLFDEAADEKLLDELPVKREFVSMYYVDKAIVWNIKREDYNRSRITKLAGHASYGCMTTRNVNTARKLAELCLREGRLP